MSVLELLAVMNCLDHHLRPSDLRPEVRQPLGELLLPQELLPPVSALVRADAKPCLDQELRQQECLHFCRNDSLWHECAGRLFYYPDDTCHTSNTCQKSHLPKYESCDCLPWCV